MHISDGIVGIEQCVAGYAAAAVITYLSLKKTKDKDLPVISVMTAVFFIASLIHLNIGPSSIHLLLHGLTGVLLGIAAFPAILVGLLFQALMFHHGGITVLGLNSLIMGVPALFAWIIFRYSEFLKAVALRGFIAAFLATMLSAGLMAMLLAANGQELYTTSRLLILLNIPLACIEGVITALLLVFLSKVRPEMLRIREPH